MPTAIAAFCISDDLQEGIPCPYCGDDFQAEVYDYSIEGRWFLFSTCCEQSYAEMSYNIGLVWPRRKFASWFLSQTGIEIRGGWMEGTQEGHLPVVLDYGLNLEPIKLADANEFIEQHHRHNGRINQFKIGAGIWNGPDIVGLVTVEPPRARSLNDGQTLEVTRVCVRSDIEPRELVANACSMAYGYACREAKKKGYRKVITYTRNDEQGVSLKAAGFRPVYHQKRAKVWSCPSRPRLTPKRPPVPKVRWERELAQCGNGDRLQTGSRRKERPAQGSDEGDEQALQAAA